jgi:hypothetical protein
LGMTPVDFVGAALVGLISATFMTLTELPFWTIWGISGVAEWQVNWVTLSILRIISVTGENREPKASWKVITSHLIHGMAAAVVFVLLLPTLLSLFPFAKTSIVLVAMAYSLALWVIFSVGLKKVYERARGIHIQRRGMFVSFLSHCVYGFFLGLLVGVYFLQSL